MSGAQMAVGLGMLVGGGVWIIVRAFLPRYPDLAEAVARMTTLPTSTAPTTIEAGEGTPDRAADWLGRKLAPRLLTLPGVRVPDRDLALLKMTRHRFLGEKALMAVIGLFLPFTATILTAVGVRLPVTVPVIAGLVLAAIMWFIPDFVVADNARKARQEFAVNMTSYIELVALERTAAAGPVQSLVNAAEVGESWVFHRIREELERAQQAGYTAWDALRNVGDELHIPELTKVANVMRVSGEEGGSVYDNLRSLARSARSRLVTSEQESSGARTESSYLPLAASMIVFVIIMMTPIAMQIA